MNPTADRSLVRATAAEIQAAFVMEQSDDRGERRFAYTDLLTGRQFAVSRLNYAHRKHRFFLREMIPNGRMLEVNDRGDIVRAWEEPRIKEIESRIGPNELLATLRAIDIEVDALVFWGAGYSADTIYHESLKTCAESIAQALNQNVRYISYIDRQISPYWITHRPIAQ
jgi:hypothetical protein